MTDNNESDIEETLHYGGRVRLTFVPNPYHRYTVAVRESDDEDWSPESRIPSATGVAGSFDDGKVDGISRWSINLAVKYLKEVFGDLRKANALDEVLFQHHLDQAGFQRLHEMRKLGTVGTVTHSWVEQHILRALKDGGVGRGNQDADLPINEQAANAVTSYLKWESKFHPEYLFTERKVYSLEHHVAGTVDIGARISGKLYIVDIKTSNSLSIAHKLQLAIYLHMINEEMGKTEEFYTHRGIVKCHKGSTRQATWYDFNERAGESKGWKSQDEDMLAFTGLRAAWLRIKE